ncbi:MAG: hypothetical protein ACPGIH_15715 [Verrucomicrobiales bacterium]
MKKDNPEIVLNHCTSRHIPLIRTFISAAFLGIYFSYRIFPTYPYGTYFIGLASIVLLGLSIKLKFSKGAFLRLSQSGIEWKSPLSFGRINKFQWTEIESLNIFSAQGDKKNLEDHPLARIETSKHPVVVLICTEASGRKPSSRFIRKMNKRFVAGGDYSLPIYYPVSIKYLYLLIYAWKLGINPIDLEDLYKEETKIITSILEYEKTLQDSLS